MSGRARIPLHGHNHRPGGSDPIPGLLTETVVPPFYDAVVEIAATRDLRGYWRLGEGGFGPYADSSGRAVPVPMDRSNQTTDMSDIATGALPAGDDDGAVQFNEDTGLVGAFGDYLVGTNNWGTGTSNPFNVDMGTVAGWVKPFASAATFDGAVFQMLFSTGVVNVGYCLGVQWPDRRVFHQRNATRLLGPTLAADEWAFVVAVKDATSTRLYVNGVLVATGTSINGEPNNNIEPKIGLWNHSAWAAGNAGGTLYGAVDEVSVWYDALSDDEIALLAAAGGLAGDPDVRSVLNVDGAYTAQPGDTVLANGTFTVTLPAASGNRNQDVIVKNVGSGTITVGRTGSDEIDGVAADVTLAAQESQTYVSDGTGWWTTGSLGGGAAFDPATATTWWFPLADSDGTLVIDGDGNLIPTLTPI